MCQTNCQKTISDEHKPYSQISWALTLTLAPSRVQHRTTSRRCSRPTMAPQFCLLTQILILVPLYGVASNARSTYYVKLANYGGSRESVTVKIADTTSGQLQCLPVERTQVICQMMYQLRHRHLVFLGMEASPLMYLRGECQFWQFLETVRMLYSFAWKN